jgi:hypothetical protein
MKGNCTGDENPDYWYPEMPTGRISAVGLKVLTQQTQYALNLCSTCPVKDECFQEGMKTEKMRGEIQGWGNLPFGIWGGSMPYERLEMAGITSNTSKGVEVLKAFALKANLESLLTRR